MFYQNWQFEKINVRLTGQSASDTASRSLLHPEMATWKGMTSFYQRLTDGVMV